MCCLSTCQAGTEDRTGVALPILNLSSRRKCGGQFHAPDSLRPGKRPGTLVLEGVWKISLVTIPTETSWPPAASYRQPVPVATRSKAWVCGHSLAGIVGSNPAGCPSYIMKIRFNPLNPELNPICCLLALLGASHFLHVSRIKVKSLTLRLLMSYIYLWSTHS